MEFPRKLLKPASVLQYGMQQMECKKNKYNYVQLIQF